MPWHANPRLPEACQVLLTCLRKAPQMRSRWLSNASQDLDASQEEVVTGGSEDPKGSDKQDSDSKDQIATQFVTPAELTANTLADVNGSRLDEFHPPW